MNNLPPYASRELILERLPLIFPEGTPNRNYLVREMAASTVFVMLYIGAVEESGVYAGPVHVYRMTVEQAAFTEENERIGYRKAARQSSPGGKRWYADNTREPIRDETLRDGLVRIGAILTASNIPTTSGVPRYQLQEGFAALFDPQLVGDDLIQAIDRWQKKYLSASALARVALTSLGADHRKEQVLVRFPNGETRHLTAGPSSEISKAVIETFANTFLRSPIVLWLSTSDNKVVVRDDEMARRIGLNIEAAKNLPDIILVDLGPDDPLLVFIEVVATDGAVTDRRQEAIHALTDEARFGRFQVAFVTAYLDRDSPGFRKTMTALAWNSFAWFLSEPDKIVIFQDGVSLLSDLIRS